MDKVKKISIILACFCLVMAMATCFATSGEQAFVDGLQEQINADNMWGAVVPIVGIIGFVFLFAFAYRILRRVLKKGSGGKFGM